MTLKYHICTPRGNWSLFPATRNRMESRMISSENVHDKMLNIRDILEIAASNEVEFYTKHHLSRIPPYDMPYWWLELKSRWLELGLLEFWPFIPNSGPLDCNDRLPLVLQNHETTFTILGRSIYISTKW